MEEIYVNVKPVKPANPKHSRNQTGPRSSQRSFHSVIVCLGLLSVFLLVGLIVLGVLYRDSAADLSSIRENLTERLQATNHQLSSMTEERDRLNANLTEMTKDRDRLQILSNRNRDSTAVLSAIKENLTERLQATNHQLSSITEERDRLNANLTEMTKEWDRLQTLSNQKKTCPEGWKMFSSTCYLFSQESDSWTKGREDCKRRGADLVVINSAEEQTFLSAFTNKPTWIGLNDIQTEGTWMWVDGTPLTQSYWDRNQPDNGGGIRAYGEEDCAHIKNNDNGGWNDRLCTSSLPWICEKLP